LDAKSPRNRVISSPPRSARSTALPAAALITAHPGAQDRRVPGPNVVTASSTLSVGAGYWMLAWSLGTMTAADSGGRRRGCGYLAERRRRWCWSRRCGTTTGAVDRRQLREAVSSRAVIDQAMGLVMAHRGCGQDEAFAVLRSASHCRNVKPRDVARRSWRRPPRATRSVRSPRTSRRGGPALSVARLRSRSWPTQRAPLALIRPSVCVLVLGVLGPFSMAASVTAFRGRGTRVLVSGPVGQQPHRLPPLLAAAHLCGRQVGAVQDSPEVVRDAPREPGNAESDHIRGSPFDDLGTTAHRGPSSVTSHSRRDTRCAPWRGPGEAPTHVVGGNSIWGRRGLYPARALGRLRHRERAEDPGGAGPPGGGDRRPDRRRSWRDHPDR